MRGWRKLQPGPIVARKADAGLLVLEESSRKLFSLLSNEWSDRDATGAAFPAVASKCRSLNPLATLGIRDEANSSRDPKNKSPRVAREQMGSLRPSTSGRKVLKATSPRTSFTASLQIRSSSCPTSLREPSELRTNKSLNPDTTCALLLME